MSAHARLARRAVAYGAAFAVATLAACGGGEDRSREFVLVALGDSYGSGEGAPEIPGRFSYDPSVLKWVGTPPTWTAGDEDAARCHRSSRSGFDRAAARLREAFATHDVTIVFRSFACSGAPIRLSVNSITGFRERPTVSGGALLPARDARGSIAPAQVAQLRAFVAASGKPADAIVMSFGGNDLGFSRVFFLCSVAGYLGSRVAAAIGLTIPAGACQFDPATAAVGAGAAAPTTARPPLDAAPEIARGCSFLTKEQVVQGRCTPSFRASLDLLGRALRGRSATTFVRCKPVQEAAAEALRPLAPPGTVQAIMGARCERVAPNSPTKPFGVWVKIEATYPRLASPVARVYVVDYPDPLEDETGASCDGRPHDDLATQQLTGAESAWLRGTFRPLLNGELASAAARNGWTLVRLADAERHGVCATHTARWFNANFDALRVQGEDIDLPRLAGAPGEPAISSGYGHPNEEGYDAMYAAPVANAIAAQICAKFEIAPCPDLDRT